MLRQNLPILLPLALLTLLAAAVRGMALGDSLWIDELHTSWVVADSLSEVGPRARLGNQQPLYFYLPAISIRLLGEHEWSLRLPSYLAGIALVPAVYWLARHWTGSQLAALTVAALAVLDRQWLFYAQEARAYALVQLAVVVQFALLGKLFQRPTAGWRLVHVALAAMLFYLHYTTALLVAAEGVAWALAYCWLRRREYSLAKMGLDLVLYLLLIAPALPHVLAVGERRENWEQFVTQPGFYDSLYVFPLDVYLLTPLVLAGLFAAGRWVKNRHEEKVPDRESIPLDYLVIAACWLLVPLAIAWLTTQTDLARLFFARYLLGASAGALLIAAFCIARQRTVVARGMLALVLVSLAAWRGGWLVPEVYTEQLASHTEEQWREAIGTLAQADSDGQKVILVDPGLIESASWQNSSDPRRQAFLTLPLRGIYRLPGGSAALIPFSRKSLQVDEQTLATIDSQEQFWLLLRGEFEGRTLAVGDSATGSRRELHVRSRHAFGSVLLLEATVGSPNSRDSDRR